MSLIARITPWFETEQEYKESIEEVLKWRTKIDSLLFDMRNTIASLGYLKKTVSFDANDLYGDFINWSDQVTAQFPSILEIGLSGLGKNPRIGKKKRHIDIARMIYMYDSLQELRKKLDVWRSSHQID